MNRAAAMAGRRLAGIGLATICLAVSVLAADTYYVGTHGDDAHDGRSEAEAFATLQRAADLVQPGDTILMLPGAYAGARIERSGTSNAPVTLRPRTPGTVTIDAPGANARHSSHLEIETWSPPYVVTGWIIEGLHVVGGGRYGIDARSTQFLTIRGNTVSNSAVTGIFTPFSYDLVIADNVSTHNGEHGIYHNNSSDRFVIRGNVMHHNRHAGLHLNADVTATPPFGTPWAHDGIMSFGLIEDNVIFANGKGGAGINMDGVEHTLLRNNLIYQTTNNSGIALFRQNAAVPSRHNRIYNNTIVMAAANPGWAVNVTHPEAVSNRVFNNILFNPHGFRGSVSIPTPGLEGFESDYNVVVNRFSADGGGSNMSLTDWQALGYDAHSILATPAALFVNPAAGDYRLRPDSPAIDRGYALPDVPRDRGGIPRPRDGNDDGVPAWDIGAHEYATPEGAMISVTTLVPPPPGADAAKLMY